MYKGQGQTKAERIMGQDKAFVMATQNTGLGMAEREEIFDGIQ